MNTFLLKNNRKVTRYLKRKKISYCQKGIKGTCKVHASKKKEDQDKYGEIVSYIFILKIIL